MNVERSERVKRRRRRTIIAALSACLAFGGINLLARHHAHAFLHFEDGGGRTAKPDELTRLAKLRVLLVGVTIPRPEHVRTPPVGYTELEFRTEDGVTLGAWHIPTPDPVGTVVLFHGYTQAADSLIDAAVGFRELGYECYLVDFRGSGRSSDSYTTLGVLEALDVRAAVAGIEPRGPLVLYGVSMGAAAILRAVAHEQVRADALILDAPFDRMLTTVRNRFDTMGVPGFPAAELVVFWGGRGFGFDGFGHNPSVDAGAVSIPTLILHGADDRHARPSDVAAVFAALSGPKQIVEFLGVGHEQIAVVRPDEWRRVTAAFLRELPSHR